MNYTCITVIVLMIISMLVNVLLLAMFLNQRSNNIKLKGAYNFINKDNTYNNKSLPSLDRLDNYLKEIMDRYTKTRNFTIHETKIPYENYDDIKTAFDKEYKLQLPESCFIPDYIFSRMYENDTVKVYYIIEFDEGNDFHSNEHDIKYVYKWLNYNRMLIDRKEDLFIIRITYPDTEFWKTNTKERTNEALMVINYIVSSLYGYAMGCYCLYRMKKDITDDNKLVLVENETIDKNKDKSPYELYKMEKDESDYTKDVIVKDEEVKLGLLEGGTTNQLVLTKRKTFRDHPLYKGSPTKVKRPIHSYNLETLINNAIYDLKTSSEEDFMYIFRHELVSNENSLNDIEDIETRNNARIYTNNYIRYYERFGKSYYKPMYSRHDYDNYNLFPYIDMLFDDYLKELERLQNMEDKEPYKLYVNLMIILIASLKHDGFLTNSKNMDKNVQLEREKLINEYSKQISKYDWFIEKHKDAIDVNLLNYLRE